MLPLPNNCHIGTISVSPKDWKSKGAAMTDWEISYRFHDPAYKDKYPYGFQVKRKGMNHIKNLEERRKETKKCIDAELMLLKEGFNPILRRYVRDELVQDVNPYTPFLSALEYARNEIKVVPKTKVNMKSQLGFLKTAAMQLNYFNLGISEIKRRHVKMLLKKIEENNPTDNNSRYNKFRTNLKILFSFLLELDYEIIESNPVSEIKKKEEKGVVRKILTTAQRKAVDMHLRKKGLMSFRLYNRIFFHSGIRNTELLKVQGKHVDLKGQWFTVTILKGKSPSVVRKTIKTIAVRYWQLALKNCGKDDYIFSVDLLPGKKQISESQINRRWNRHVKKDLGVTVDHYAFKHANTTEVVKSAGSETAAAINSHTSTAMVKKIYDVERDAKEHENIKEVKNYF